MRTKTETGFVARLIQKSDAILRHLREKRLSLNNRMEGRLSPRTITLLSTAVAGFVILLLLVVPPALSQYPNDSMELLRLAGAAGLRVEGTLLLPVSSAGGDASLHMLLLRMAIRLDRLLHGNTAAPLQSVALLYTLLFLPSFALLLNELLQRIAFFSERIAVALLCLFILMDSSRIVPFASLSPLPLWHIGLVALLAGLLAAARGAAWGIPVLATAGLLLTLSAKQGAVLGVLTAAFAGGAAARKNTIRRRASAAFAAVGLLAGSFFSGFVLPDNFTHTARLHAMTRGVLLQAQEPEKALREFGIAPRFSVLTDVSAFEAVPAVAGEDSLLDEDFLERAAPMRIGLYYVRHPFSAVAMLDLAVRATMDTSSIYRSASDMPGALKLSLLSGYSALKARAMPTNLAFALLLFAIGMFAGRKQKKQSGTPGARRAIVLLMSVGVTQAFLVIVRSGDAELAQRAAMTGISIDLLIVVVAAMLLHRLNILDADETEGSSHEQTA